ncbi:hypothetical protein JCM3766R1_003523, partial [Sporobolomyces carnicolor]
FETNEIVDQTGHSQSGAALNPTVTVPVSASDAQTSRVADLNLEDQLD